MRNITSAISTLAILMAADGGGSESADLTADPAIANGATLAPLTDDAKVTEIKKAMTSRKRYSTLALAIEAFKKAGAATENFYDLPVGIVGMDSEGNVDEAVYEGMNAILGYVGSKGDEAKGKQSGVKAIVIYPVPDLTAFLDSAEGRAWRDKVMEKETALVVFRNFRDAATLDEFQAGIAKTPKTVAEYIAEHARGGAGLDTETFDATWTGLRLFLKNKQPLLAKALPAKPEVIKCIRSKSYANENPDTAKLESAGVFVKLAQTCVNAAKNNKNEKTGEANPLDTSAIEAWLAGRDSLEIKKPTKEAVDVDAAVAAFGAWAQ